MRWRFGNFSLNHLMGAITANRVILWPDKDGTIGVIQGGVPFAAAVPLNGVTTFAPYTVNTNTVVFALASSPQAGGRAIYRLVGDGANAPTFNSDFLERSDSTGYDRRTGIVNFLQIDYDGTNAWYSITQRKNAIPAMISASLTFPNRTANVSVASNTYTTTGSGTPPGTGVWSGQMVSAQTIPANKAGRVVVRVDDYMLVGLKTLSTVQTFTNFDYQIWIANGSIFTNTAGGSAVTGGTVSNTNTFIRIVRNSNGTVTVETSPDQTTWTLQRTFGNTNANALYIAADISDSAAARQLEIISFEIEV